MDANLSEFMALIVKKIFHVYNHLYYTMIWQISQYMNAKII